ncbi:hypothetical protein ACWAU3_09485 [Shewanella sp. JL219SE-S6]
MYKGQGKNNDKKDISCFWDKLFIVGCANIPLGTMLSLSSFDEQDFVQLNPQVIRSQILIDAPGKLDLDTTELTLELDSSKGISSYRFPLRLESTEIIPKTRDCSAPAL